MKAVLVLMMAGLLGCAAPHAFRPSPASRRTPSDEARLRAVVTFADNVLARGRDRWSGRNSPLFADGLDPVNDEPAVWRYNGKSYVISNLASQQNLLRVLNSLTALTGEPTYREAAEDAVRYHFDHLADSSGLLQWGGHRFIDLATLRSVGDFDVGQHEFKNHFPYYEFLWEVDPTATARFLRALWNAHVTNWSVLDLNRHGAWGKPMGALWASSWSDPEPYFESEGLTFINAGSDLIYAAGMLYEFTGDEGARTWAHRLAEMYVRARHPDTGLGAYQYSKPRRRRTPVIPMATDRHTWGDYGDRAENQFGDRYANVYNHQFRDVAREGWVLWRSAPRGIYVGNALMQLTLAERLGAKGADYLNWTVDGLKAFSRHAYDPARNLFRPMWADGTDLSGRFITNYGYYNQSNDPRPFEANPADGAYLAVYARAYRLSQDSELWPVVRDIARGNGLGDLGRTPDEPMTLKFQTDVADAEVLFAVLELYRIRPEPDLLTLARRIGDNIVAARFHHGFFLPSAEHRYARFNDNAPLALLALDAVIRGTPQAVPEYVASRGYIHGRYDGHGRTYDSRVVWPQLRSGE